jgi:hypothetical protein
MRDRPFDLLMERNADGLFIYADGVKIAKRGEPNTPHAKTWISLEPGYSVLDEDDYSAIVVEYKAQGRGVQ